MNIISISRTKLSNPSIAVRGFSIIGAKYKEIESIKTSEINNSIRKEHHVETADIKKARLMYQSRQRGILENCLLLGTFANKYLDGFDEKQLQMYDNLINLPSNDWDIYYWAIGREPVPSEFDNEIMDMLKEHTRNKDMEARIL